MNIHKTRHIIPRLATALAALAMLVLSSCASDNDEVQEADSKTVVVVFQLSIPRTEAATTRSTTEGVAAGNELEHRLSNMHVLLCDKKLDVITQQVGLRITPIATATTGNVEYSANVEVSMQVENPEKYQNANGHFEGELVIIANSDGNEFSLSSNTDPDALPMWGMRNITDADAVAFTPGERIDFRSGDAIDLMRAVAKVTVDLTDEMVNDGWTFEMLKLTKYNTKGYVMPKVIVLSNGKGYKTATDLMTYPDDDNNERFNPYTERTSTVTINAGAASDLDFNNGTAATEGLPLYIPEYDNTTSGVTPATIRLKLMHNNDSEGTTYELEFANYNGKDDHASDTKFNIVRNTWYQYHVYKLSEHKIGVTLTVKPWYYVEHDPIVM